PTGFMVSTQIASCTSARTIRLPNNRGKAARQAISSASTGLLATDSQATRGARSCGSNASTWPASINATGNNTTSTAPQTATPSPAKHIGVGAVVANDTPRAPIFANTGPARIAVGTATSRP